MTTFQESHDVSWTELSFDPGRFETSDEDGSIVPKSIKSLGSSFLFFVRLHARLGHGIVLYIWMQVAGNNETLSIIENYSCLGNYMSLCPSAVLLCFLSLHGSSASIYYYSLTQSGTHHGLFVFFKRNWLMSCLMHRVVTDILWSRDDSNSMSWINSFSFLVYLQDVASKPKGWGRVPVFSAEKMAKHGWNERKPPEGMS